MVELGPDDLAEAAESTGEAAEAAADVAGAAPGDAATEVGRTASNAIREFAELKRAERELQQVMAEEQDTGTGLGEAIAEGAKVVREDPELIQAFKAYLWDIDASEVEDPPAIAAQPAPADHAAAEGRELPAATDGAGADRAGDLADRELDPDLAFDVGKLLLGELAARHPTMTLSELREATDEQLESLQDKVGDQQMADLYERSDAFEGPIKAALQDKL